MVGPLSLAILLLAGPAAAEDSPVGMIHLGGMPFVELQPPRPGRHVGAVQHVGDVAFRSVWEPGSDPWLERVDGEGPPLLPGYPARDELVVVVSVELAGESEVLPHYLDLRRAEGWEVTLATEAEWDQPVQSGPDDSPWRIRAWLQDNYGDDPGAFVLLIGDPRPGKGPVCMVDTHPLQDYVPWYGSDIDPIPSDHFYADLTGDWDCDDDGLYAEYPDDADCVDFAPELHVGRLPIYYRNATMLDLLLTRLMDEDLAADKSHRGRILLPGALLAIAGAPDSDGDLYGQHHDGASVLDAVYRHLSDDQQAGTTRLYENAGLVTSPYPHEGGISVSTVVSEWSKGQGVVLWSGHGFTKSVGRMYWMDDDDDDEVDANEVRRPDFLHADDTEELEGVPGAFCFQMSCSNGKPEDQSNLGTALLGSGAIGTVSASRLSFGVFQYYGETWVPRADSPYGEVAGYYFTMKLVDGMTAGEALAYTRYALPGDDHPPMAWTTKLEFNLYGDPTRSLEQCDTAADCDDGSPCTGTESCEDGACVHTGAVDCAHLDDACTVGSCDPDSGECVSVPRIDGAPCDDGLYCTTDDACFEGECSGVERECSEREGYDAWCDEDEESCVWEEQKKGGCQHRPGAPLGPWFLALLALGGLWLRGSRGEA